MTTPINKNLINFPKPSAPKENLQISRIQEISVKTLYAIGVIFSMVSLNLFLAPVFMMDATALSVGISILSFKGAYDIHTKGQLELPKITLNTGVFQIGLV